MSLSIQSLDSNHVRSTLLQAPVSLHQSLKDEYLRLYGDSGRRTANLYMLDMQDTLSGADLLISSESGLQVKAKRLARDCAKRIQAQGVYSGIAFCEEQNLIPPTAQTEAGLIARLSDSDWWLGQLAKQQNRQREHVSIKAGLVCRGKQPYCSDVVLKNVLERQVRSLKIMEGLEAVSDSGETVNMLDVLKGSVANPAVRRAELMTRLNGFEAYAKDNGHIAEFYTITAPSKYHPVSDKYNSASPRDTQAYLCQVWAQIRAKLKRDDLPVYGFRIAEPHHDSTPHWHILLFLAPANKFKVRSILRNYALREDGNELGAAKRRFTVESINPNKGSAVGYIAKYISKNIDGFGMQSDFDDETGDFISDTAQRVRAWASTWGIRQFQQIGGAGVGVWRELRRMEQAPEGLEPARQAADTGDWKAYLELQGGADLPRKYQPIQLLKTDVDTDTGEMKTNKYGELVEYVKGVFMGEEHLITRLEHWTIQPIEQEEVKSRGPNVSTSLSSSAGVDDTAPWSTVNNCTRRAWDGMFQEKDS